MIDVDFRQRDLEKTIIDDINFFVDVITCMNDQLPQDIEKIDQDPLLCEMQNGKYDSKLYKSSLVLDRTSDGE